MNKTLVISDAQSKYLLDLYISKIKEIDAIIAPYLSEKSEYEDLVRQLQGVNAKPTAPVERRPVNGNLFGGSDSEYDATWSVPKKGNFILSKEHRELSTSEVFDKLLAYEPELSEKRPITMVLLSSAFKEKTGKTIYRVGEKRNEYKYGLLEWKKEEADIL